LRLLTDELFPDEPELEKGLAAPLADVNECCRLLSLSPKLDEEVPAAKMDSFSI
jgi:hypothetical protein